MTSQFYAGSPQTKRRKLNSPRRGDEPQPQPQQCEENGQDDIDVMEINVSHIASCCNNDTAKDENAAEQEEEEEEDFDVMEINAKTQTKKNELKIFGIGNVLSNVVSNLSIVEIIKLRGINKLFNNELEFGFECKNFNIFFNYKNKYIIGIINNHYCNSLEHLTLFYLQSFNIKKSAFGFKRVVDKKNVHTKNNEHCEEKSGLTQKYIFCVSIKQPIS